MNWMNIAVIGGVALVGIFVVLPMLKGKGGPNIPPPQIVPEIDPVKPLTFRHTSVQHVGQISPRFFGDPSYKAPPKARISSRFPKGGVGNCHYPSPGSVCWNSTCMPFNAKSSDASSVSGRQTLCSRARSKYLAQNVGSKSLSYVGQRIGMA